MHKAACLLLIALLLNSAVSAQCEETVLGPVDTINHRWESAALRGDQAVYARGGFASGITGPVLAEAFVYFFWDAGTPDDAGDDRWILQASLSDPNGPDFSDFEPGELFADDAAIEDDALLLAASGYFGRGTVYSYAKDDKRTPDVHDDEWIPTGELQSLAEFGGTSFANSMCLKDDLLAVGNARTLDSEGAISGSVSIYHRSRQGTPSPLDDSWHKLDEVHSPVAEDYFTFGEAVSIDGEYLLVGSRQDRAFVFKRGSTSLDADTNSIAWHLDAELVPSSDTNDTRYGWAVALCGDRAVVGAPRDDESGIDAGAVYVFRRSAAGVWNEESKLLPRDARPYDYVGSSVDIDGETILIGAPGDDARDGPGDIGLPFSFSHSEGEAGGAYLFSFEPSTMEWVEQFKLSASNRTNYFFGEEVHLDAERMILIGTSCLSSGLSWIFRRDEALCASPSQLSVSDGGVAEFNFNAGLGSGHTPYFLLGSLSGSSPGVELPSGLTLPLVPDVYFQLTKKAGDRLFSDFSGDLPRTGSARASLTVPPLSEPGLAGLTLHHALVVGEDISQATLVSNPVSLHLRP